MARGIMRPVQERVFEIDTKIDGLQSKINHLKAQRKSLMDADRTAKVQKVLEAAESKGMSVDAIIDRLSHS